MKKIFILFALLWAAGLSAQNIQADKLKIKSGGWIDISGYGVHGVSNDPNLADSSTLEIVTEAAAKAYADSVVASAGGVPIDSITAHRTDLDNLQTLTGRVDGSTHMGTYAGATITDNQTIKQNIQELETAIERDLPVGSEIQSTDAIPAGDSAATFQILTNQIRDSITTGDISALLNSAIINRQYDAIVRVDSTIRYTLQEIADASMEKRYLVYVPDGTYNEDSLYINPWIDVVGESRSGTIVQSTSVLGDDDVFWIDGGNVMLANMTVRHTRNIGDPGVTKYPIHCDRTADGTFTDPKNSTVIFYNLTVEALGTDAKAAFGIGVQSAQRIYIYNCTATSSRIPGIYAHNTVSATKPSLLYVINSTATGGNYGIQYDNIGSSSGADFIGLWGTEFSGATFDIYLRNAGAGAGETNYYIDPSCIYSTKSIVDTTKELSFPVFSIPQNTHPTYATYEGNTLENRSGYADFDNVGITTLGRLGIGTASPAYPLHVYTTSRDISIFSQQYKTSGTTYAGYFQNALNTGAGDSYALYALNTSTKTGVDWGLWAQGERHYVSNDFGIGTTTPATRLHVYKAGGSVNVPNYSARFTTTGTGAILNGFGSGIELSTKSQTASEIVNARLATSVTDTTTASFDADVLIDAVINGTLTNVGRFRGTVLDVPTGYRIANAATSGNYLRGNGTNFVSSAIQASDLPAISQIQDADTDTKIQVEESADEDVIRFDVFGTEVMTINTSEVIITGEITATSTNFPDTVFLTITPLGLETQLSGTGDILSDYIVINDDLAGYTLSEIYYNVYTAGTGTGSVDIRTVIDDLSRTARHDLGTVTLSSGEIEKQNNPAQPLEKGDIILIERVADTITGKPEGLTATYMLTK